MTLTGAIMDPKDQLNELRVVIGDKSYDYGPKKRKTTDSSFRTWLGTNFRFLMDEIALVKNVALQSQMIMIWGDLDKFLLKLKDLQILIESTEYEGSTFFRSAKIVNEEENKIIGTEFNIIEKMKNVLSRTSEFKDSIDAAMLTETSRLVADIGTLLNDVKNSWNLRKDVIVKFRYI